MTYAGNLMSLAPVAQSERFAFEEVDICDRAELARVFTEHQPDCVIHIWQPKAMLTVLLTARQRLLKPTLSGLIHCLRAARAYWNTLTEDKKSAFRFHHISTDEVYGDLHSTDDFFTETTPYAPSSLIPRQKPAATIWCAPGCGPYGLPTLITNCSNNYGPYHFPEKLIPLMILNALAGKPLPVYGNGQQIRDWLYVEDHARALYCVATTGKVGETYNIGGHNERKNLSMLWKPFASCWKNWLRTSRTAWRTIVT